MLAEIVQGKKEPVKISLQALFAFTSAITVLVGWEVYEFTMDRLYGFVMQHGQLPYGVGLTDTMVDLLLGAGGALFAMFYESFKKAGLVGKGRKEIRAKVVADRARFKADKRAGLEY